MAFGHMAYQSLLVYHISGELSTPKLTSKEAKKRL
jgi:hypothetical protein